MSNNAQQAADKLQARIEADHRAAGRDPNMADLHHTDNDAWKALNEQAQASS